MCTMFPGTAKWELGRVSRGLGESFSSWMLLNIIVRCKMSS